uniref:Adenylate kinase 7a n=1 Tax=Cyprinodon variegatus TaxID=28743 RepID=A0A3Q2DS21_CYPVA
KPGAEEESEDDESPSPWDEPAFQIIGTVSSTEGEKLPFLHQKYVSPSRDELLQLLLECDVVVYNVTESSTQQQVEEATWAVTALLNEMENFKSRKYFILVSSVMTWAMSKPKENTINSCNQLSLLQKTSKLKGYVVGAGLQYGMGEDIFHYFFKVSWLLQDPKVPIFGNGTNYIPMIHVGDLGRVIQNVIKLKPKSKYILAVDESHNTLEDVVKAISNVLGPEKVCKVPLEDAITMKAFKELDCLSINLRMDAAVDSDTFSFNWICRDGMVENMENIADEYKRARQLLPIKIFLVGPPAAGKTTVAEKLCQLYKLNHINISRMIEEKTTKLKDLINEAELDDVHEEAAAAAQQQLEIINQSMEKNQGQLDESLIFEILREKLYSKPCRNQGFVLDGFPETFEQAKVIFSGNQDSELISKIPRYNKIITPEHVFVLEASDDFLMRRVQGLPQSTAEKMSYTQEEFVPRLARYRQLFCTQETLLDFFDYREIHPQYIGTILSDLEYAGVMKKITEDVGVPRNYSPNPEEQKDENRRKEEEIKQKLVPETEEKKIRKTAALAEMTKHYEEWNLSVVEQEESELLEAKALPLRNYLMKYVMPSLSAAMLECSKIKPEDPVDFLAEHLLQNNQDN